MGKININSNTLAFTLVPDFLIEELMKNLSGNSLKVILCILNGVKLGKNLTTEGISLVSGVSEEYVYESLTELKELGILIGKSQSSLDFDLIFDNSQITNVSKVEQPISDDAIQSVKPKELSEKEIIFKELLSEIEMIMGFPLNNGYLNFLNSLRDEFRFPDEVILTLFNHCASKKKTSIKYMEQVAVNWKENGINSLEDANNIIKEYEDKWIKYRKALNYMGLKADYISYPHERLLDKWFSEYKMSDEVIQKAADITIMNLGKAEIPYMEKIISDWYKKGVKTVSDIEKLDYPTQSKNRRKFVPKPQSGNFNKFTQRNYDMDELENKLLGWKKNE